MYDIAIVLVRQGTPLVSFLSWLVIDTLNGIGTGRRAVINKCAKGSRVHPYNDERFLINVSVVSM